jgi:hypothetical protein
MERVAQTPTKRYAVYYTEDGTAIYGQAEFLRHPELLDGYGWIFRSDDGLWMVPITREDALHGKADLFGWVHLADAQLAADLAKREAEAQAGRCQACGMIGCRGDQTCAGETITQLAAIMAE